MCVCMHMHTHAHTHTREKESSRMSRACSSESASVSSLSSLVIAPKMTWESLITFEPHFQLLLSFELPGGGGRGEWAAWTLSKEPLSPRPGIKLVAQQS